MNSQKFVTKDGIEFTALVFAFDQFHGGLAIAKSDLEKAGTIQYFKFTYELAWKTLRRILKERGKDLNSPKTVFREAKSAFEESDLPLKVDLILWADIDDHFKTMIQLDLREF